MNHIYRTVNRYHHDFESFRGVVKLTSVWVWGFVVASVGMGYSFVWYASADVWPYDYWPQGYRLILVLFFELIAILCWARLQWLRDKSVVERCQKNFGTNSESMIHLKSLWFKHTLNDNKNSYLDLALQIDKMIDLSEKHKSSFRLGKKQMIGLVFSLESKSRILAMFMGLCAAVVALSIANGARLDDLIYLFHDESLWQMSGIVFFVSIIFMFTFLVFRYILIFIAVAFENLFNLADGLNSTSKRRVSNFINQLISLHELEKARIRRF